MPEHQLPDGRTFPYEERGHGSAVLVLHDVGQTPAGLASLVEALADLGRIIVPQLGAPADLARTGADAAALLTALDAAPATVIGIGAGAAAALAMAVDCASVVHRVIADSPALPLTPEAKLGDVMCHVVLVWGAADGAISPAERTRIALQVPRAARVDYPGGPGGFAAHQRRFLADLRTWLGQDPAPARLPMNETRPTARRGPVVFDV